MVVVAGGISVIITDTNLSGVTGIAISDTAATLDANRSYASRQKQRALARSGWQKRHRRPQSDAGCRFCGERRFIHRRLMISGMRN
jgi:hypothetical protein